nr:surface carbohydrate biosynthesis protein [uncultured Pseudodesulfovibrio sp.]
MLCAFQVEIIIRELDGVLYQALHLADKGLPSLVGDRMVNEIVRSTNAPLIYFDSDQHEPTNRHILNNGGIVLNLNSEGQGFVDDPLEMQRNFAQVIDSSTAVCLWGEKQAEILKGLIPESRHGDIIVTGHPSFDLISPPFTPYFADQSILREHGDDYILINTSFGMFNHEMGFDYYIKMLSKMSEWKVYGSPEHIQVLKRRCAFQEKTALSMIDLAKELTKSYPDRHIIIRPHPAENAMYYDEKTSEDPGIFVIKEGTAREWISSAATIIHHDCTTGMEATLMGKMVLQYAPYKDIENSAALMTTIGHRTTTADEVLQYIEKGSLPKESQRTLLLRLAPYLENINKNAAKTIAQLAADYATEHDKWTPKPMSFWENMKCWRKYISKLLRAKQPGRNGRKVRYALNKFSRLKKENVEKKLFALREIEPTLPEVSVTQLCLNTFLIEPEK